MKRITFLTITGMCGSVTLDAETADTVVAYATASGVWLWYAVADAATPT